jgi:hypothetical protein
MKQFSIIGRVVSGNQGKVVRLSNRLIQGIARPKIGIARLFCTLPCGIQPVGKACIFIGRYRLQRIRFIALYVITRRCVIKLLRHLAACP